jgi:hypothetical protein
MESPACNLKYLRKILIKVDKIFKIDAKDGF